MDTAGMASEEAERHGYSRREYALAVDALTRETTPDFVRLSQRERMTSAVLVALAAERANGWVIEVCRTCNAIAVYPFCEHRPASYDPKAVPWTRYVDVVEVEA